MNRIKKGEHSFTYVCPKCNMTIASSRPYTHSDNDDSADTHNGAVNDSATTQ